MTKLIDWLMDKFGYIRCDECGGCGLCNPVMGDVGGCDKCSGKGWIRKKDK